MKSLKTSLALPPSRQLSRRGALKTLGGLGLVAAAGIAPQPARAQAAATTLNEAGFYRFTVGDYRLTAISDGTLTFPASFYGVNAGDDEVSQVLARHHLPAETVTNQSICLLIDTGQNLVLIDTGFGPFAVPGAPPTAGKLLATLETLGVDPRDVDTVILTHGHPDHVGANVDAEGRATFPNARYVMQRLDWDYWTERARSENPADQEDFSVQVARVNLLPIADRTEWIEGGVEIVAGIRAVEAFGHTPGHMALAITSGGEQLLHIADAAGHFLIALEHPEWYGGYDLDPDRAMAVRLLLLDRAAADGVRVFGYHFPFPGLGFVVEEAREDNWRWTPTS